MARIEFVVNEAEALVLKMMADEAAVVLGIVTGHAVLRIRTKRERELALQLHHRLTELASDIRQWQVARKAQRPKHG